MTWTKSFDDFPFWEEGMYLTNDEASIYLIRDDSSTSVQIMQLSASDGSITSFYEK